MAEGARVNSIIRGSENIVLDAVNNEVCRGQVMPGLYNVAGGRFALVESLTEMNFVPPGRIALIKIMKPKLEGGEAEAAVGGA